ncbi:MAG: polysaccharide biosynthesis tyrosine autokinase [Pyrinomonas methylaliphatogenes]|nr:polysaccharide biosynthesis tyrosine autokinase [Pyrinomonas methylaliphatogenes]
MQDNRLLPLSQTEQQLDRPLHDLTLGQPATFIEQAHLREYWAIVYKRRWLILSLALAVTSLVAIYMYRQPNVYEAMVTIDIEPRRSVLQTKGDVQVVSVPNDPNYWSTQIKLLQNPQLARQVALTLDLPNNPAFLSGQAGPSLTSSLRRIFSRRKKEENEQGKLQVVTDSEVDAENLTPEQLAKLEPYEEAILAGITVEPVEKTNLVNIKFQHSDPEMAAKVANTIADVFIYNNLERETQGAQRASVLLAKQIAELQLKIRQGEEARINYLRSHNLPLGQAKGQNLTLERLATLSGQLLEAENERKNLQSAYEAAQRETDIWSVPEVQSDQRIQKLRDRIGELEEKRAALLVQYTPEWPEVKKVDEQIKRLKQDLDKAPYEVIKAMKSRYEAALARENKLKQAYYQEAAAANEQNQAEIELSRITQELETNKQFYNTLFQRQKELEITSNDRANNITVATPARVPREPVGPKRLRNILIALLVALGAGIGLAFLLDYLDDTLKSAEDVERYLHLPTLALIPAPRTERLLLKGKASEPEGVAEKTALALISDVRSPITEAYRHLRTQLLLSTAGQPPRTVLLTSSQPSEGKTTTAVNMAMMLAQMGAEVLLLDCDLRRPRVHVHFNLANAKGVANYLAGERNLDALMQTYAPLPNLKIMTSGPVPPSPAELLSSEEMRRLIDEASARFAHVIIDSPPAVSFTDAAILSTMVDGVVLVVHGGHSSRAIVRRAKKLLQDVGAHIIGVVLNNVKLDAHDYQYYANYYAAYYDEEEDERDLPEGAAERGAH